MSRLFRAEAIESQRRDVLGDVIIARPLSQTILTLFLIATVVIISLLAMSGSYARKETVHGFLSPDKGIVKVHAPRAGIIGDIYVEEGEPVEAGTALVTLLGERITADGVAVDARALRALDAQLAEIDLRRDLESRFEKAERGRLRAAIDGLNAALTAIGNQQSVQQRLIGRLKKSGDRIRSLAEQGFISNEEYLRREETVLAAEQVQAELAHRHAATTAELRQMTLALQRLPLEIERRLSELASSRSDLVRRRTELAAQQSLIITAPTAGTVTALRAIKGMSVDPQLPLLTVLPDGSKLRAHLFVPSRAIGFIEVGQDVRLLYDAFDYRRYGVQAGTVTGISSSVFSPAETGLETGIKVPAYRVTVQIERQTVAAHGRAFSLQAGMSLRADIILEKRTLIEWLFEPLLSLRGRG